MSAKKDGILTTKGTTSRVTGPADETLHILMLDVDGYKYQSILKAMKDAPGHTIISRSSEDNYHVYNLSLRPLLETAGEMLTYKMQDEKHTAIGYRRGQWTLRIAPKKYNKSDEIYREAPEILTGYYNPTNYLQSRPHYRLFQALGADLPEKGSFWGESATIEQYLTVVDGMLND